MKRFLLISLLICVLTDARASYYNDPVVIRHDGDEYVFLNNATVTSIFKDSHGYMWFATDRALYSYAGVSPREFRYNFSRRTIIDMCETPQELFFLFDNDGSIACFDRRWEQYIPVVYSNNLIDTNFNYYTYSAKTGLYAANSNGLFAVDFKVENSGLDRRLVLNARKVKQINHSLHHAASDTSGYIYSIERETLDVIRYSHSSGAVMTYDIDLKTKQDAHSAYRFFVFDDTFWFTYYWNGLFCYDMKSGRQLVFDPNDVKNKLGVDYAEIAKIVKLDHYNYALATQNGIVNINFDSRQSFDNFKVEFLPYIHDVRGNFIEPRTMALCVDEELELLWSGTYGGGVVKYGDALDTHVSLPVSQIYSVTEDKRGYVWLTTAREGIMRSDQPKLNKEITFSVWSGLPAANRKRLRMYNDGDHYLWFGDNFGNFIRVDQYDESVTKFYITLDGKTPHLTRINAMCVDSRGDMWIASDSQLLWWDQRDDKFQNVVIEGLPVTRINHIIEDRQGTIWIGTENGVFMIELKDSIYRAFGGYEKMVDSEPSEVYALDINGKGDMIATYSDKLIRVSAHDKRKVEYSFDIDSGHLPSGHIFKILDDKYGNTWLGASNRIMTVRSGGSHIFTYSMTSNNHDGCRMRDGRLLWTSSEGLIYFDPEDAHREATSADYVISRVKVRNEDVYTGQIIDGVQVFDKPINDVDTLVFREGMRDFQLYVVDLSFTPFEKQLQYKLEPVESEWTTRAANLGLSFHGLKSGEYKLYIRPLFWNDVQGEEKVFTIIVKSKWYNSIIARIVFAIAILIGLWQLFMYLYRSWQKLKHRHIHRVLDAISNNTDQDVLDAVSDESQSKMLIVGDDKVLSAVITEIFESDFDIRYSSNSANGLIDALFHLPNVIICFYQMEDALVCCEKMKNNERTCSIPFIMVDTLDDTSSRIKAIEARADDYVVYYGGGEDFLLRQVVDNRVAGRDALHQIYSRILTERNEKDSLSLEVMNESTQQFVGLVNQTIEHNLKDPDFSVKRLAELMGMSQSTLYRRLMAASGKTVIEAIRDARLRHAAELLYEGKLTIQAISEEIGYLDVATFRKHFVDLYGVNPSRFTKQ